MPDPELFRECGLTCSQVTGAAAAMSTFYSGHSGVLEAGSTNGETTDSESFMPDNTWKPRSSNDNDDNTTPPLRRSSSPRSGRWRTWSGLDWGKLEHRSIQCGMSKLDKNATARNGQNFKGADFATNLTTLFAFGRVALRRGCTDRRFATLPARLRRGRGWGECDSALLRMFGAGGSFSARLDDSLPDRDDGPCRCRRPVVDGLM